MLIYYISEVKVVILQLFCLPYVLIITLCSSPTTTTMPRYLLPSQFGELNPDNVDNFRVLRSSQANSATIDASNRQHWENYDPDENTFIPPPKRIRSKVCTDLQLSNGIEMYMLQQNGRLDDEVYARGSLDPQVTKPPAEKWSAVCASRTNLINRYDLFDYEAARQAGTFAEIPVGLDDNDTTVVTAALNYTQTNGFRKWVANSTGFHQGIRKCLSSNGGYDNLVDLRSELLKCYHNVPSEDTLQLCFEIPNRALANRIPEEPNDNYRLLLSHHERRNQRNTRVFEQALETVNRLTDVLERQSIRDDEQSLQFLAYVNGGDREDVTVRLEQAREEQQAGLRGQQQAFHGLFGQEQVAGARQERGGGQRQEQAGQQGFPGQH